MIHRRGALLFALALAGCASAGPAEIERLRAARFVLLGEVHDNAEHHRQRAQLLRELLADGRRTTVVFEQMARAHDAAIAAAPRDADAIADAGRLDRRAWRWPLHKPLFDAALAGGAALRGGDLARGEVRAIARDGLDAAPADIRAALGADGGWSAAQQGALRRLVDVGHCHALPASRLGAMVLAQRARDAALARALLAASPSGERAVLIAGNGHVRTDVGVPHHLRAAGIAAAQIIAVGFTEDGAADDAPYELRRRTPAAERPDPCEAFRQR